jgi:hypothetical protein
MKKPNWKRKPSRKKRRGRSGFQTQWKTTQNIPKIEGVKKKSSVFTDQSRPIMEINQGTD